MSSNVLQVSASHALDGPVTIPMSLLASLIRDSEASLGQPGSENRSRSSDAEEFAEANIRSNEHALAQALYQAHLPETLPRAVAEVLYADLRRNHEDFDAFRYEMFAKRIVAAEHGRSDAVEWAMKWFGDLLAQQRSLGADALVALEVREAQRLSTRKDLAAGKCGNPIFQAYLDTVEDPVAELYREDGSFNGWKFLVWLSPIRSAFEGMPKPRSETWPAYVRARAETMLSPRVESMRKSRLGTTA